MTRRAAVLLFGAVLSCLAACTHPSGLERTWERAGKNRAELEKVLCHYGDDSRKHRAALFLLEQMADCYSWSGTNIDTLKRLKQLSGLPGKEAWTDSVKKAWNFPQLLSCTKVYDAQVITADFLIRHIDHALPYGTADHGRSTIHWKSLFAMYSPIVWGMNRWRTGGSPTTCILPIAWIPFILVEM